MEKDEHAGCAPSLGTSPEDYADWLFDEISGMLRDRSGAGPWVRLDSRATKAELWEAVNAARAERFAYMARADSAFQALHDWVMDGNPLPSPWRKHYAPRNTTTD